MAVLPKRARLFLKLEQSRHISTGRGKRNNNNNNTRRRKEKTEEEKDLGKGLPATKSDYTACFRVGKKVISKGASYSLIRSSATGPLLRHDDARLLDSDCVEAGFERTHAHATRKKKGP